MNYSTYIRTLLTLLLLCCGITSHSQVIPEPVTDEAVYLFLDELAGDGIIDMNRVVKPYPRKVIAGQLQEADSQRDLLSRRQQKELDFWLVSYSLTEGDGKLKLLFNPATAQYRDSLFSVTVSPILGLTAGTTPDASADWLTGVAQTRTISWKNGAKVYGNYKNWAFYTSPASVAGTSRTAPTFPR